MTTENKKLYFFDDDMTSHLNKAKYDLNNAEFEQIEFVPVERKYLGLVAQEYQTGILTHNGYPKYNKNQLLVARDREMIYPGSGLTTKEFDLITEAMNDDKVAALIFDWDRTFTLIEGLFLPPLVPQLTKMGIDGTRLAGVLEVYKKLWKVVDEKFTEKDLAEYYLHDPLDPERVSKLKKVLKDAESRNIPIFILTNNDIPQTRPKLMADILSAALDVNIPLSHIISAGPSHNKSKGQSIIQDILPMVQREEASAFLVGLEDESSAPASYKKEEWKQAAKKRQEERDRILALRLVNTEIGGKRHRRSIHKTHKKKTKKTKKRKNKKTKKLNKRKNKKTRRNSKKIEENSFNNIIFLS